MQSQTLVNRAWDVPFGEPASSMDWSASVTNAYGYLYTTGNKTLPNGKIALYLSAHDPDGALLWEQTFTQTGIDASYGLAITLDNAGRIYVAGTAYYAATQQHDFLVLKYAFSGTLSWYYTHNGSGNRDDYAVDLVVDASQNVYVTGPSTGTGTQIDYMTLRIHSSGAYAEWVERYDYAQLDDAPANIRFYDANTVEVTGGSAVNSTDWDIAAVQYPLTGVSGWAVVNRQSSYGLDRDKPLDYDRDAAGNLYLCGSFDNGATGYDIKVIKYEPDLDLIWQTTLTPSNQEDGAGSIVQDGNGNVLVSGFAANDGGGRDLALMKLDYSGAQQWEQRRSAENLSLEATAERSLVDTAGNIYLSGREETAAGSRIRTQKYGPEGELLWERIYEGDPDGPGKANALLPGSEGAVLVTGVVKENGTLRYVALRYEEYDRNMQAVLDSAGTPSHVLNEIIIRFSPKFVDTTFVDNRQLRFGSICEVIEDSSLLEQIAQKMDLGPGEDICDCTLLKIHPLLTTESFCITTRLGDPLHIPPLWSKFILKPCGNSGKNEKEISQALDSISIDYVFYAHPNYAGQLGSTCPDPLCEEQHSLWDTPEPDYGLEASINILPAWDYNTGSSDIKVGVFDSGLFYEHEDFGYGEVVENVWDFFNIGDTGPEEIVEDPNGHGTRAAGIIGAIRNNNGIGIAGIAGGDSSEGGVRLFGLKIAADNGNIFIAIYDDAVLFSAISNDNAPLIDIVNNSWYNEIDGPEDIPANILEATEIGFNAGMLFVNIRGNAATEQATTVHGVLASMDDEFGISVGSSGVDGELKDDENGDIEITPEYDYFSMYGNGMDIIAPGSAALIRTTDNADGAYTFFLGTSSAGPHVSGVAGLLMSESNITLSPEDVERILEYSATDLGETGYDEETGWGKLNAGAALDFIDQYQVVHFSPVPAEVLMCDYTEEDAACGLTFLEEYFGEEEGYEEGELVTNVKVFKYTATVNIDVRNLTGDPNSRIVNLTNGRDGYWVRNSASNLWAEPEWDDPPIPPTVGSFEVTPRALITFENPILIEDHTFQATLTGYAYKIYDENDQLEESIPPGLETCETPRLGFSLLIESSVIIETEEEIREENIRLFPNPSNGQFTVEVQNLSSLVLGIDIVNINGQVIRSFSGTGYTSNHPNSMYLDLNELPAGTYFCRIRTEENIYVEKMIKL